MSAYNWSNYNNDSKLFNALDKFNKKNKFNYVEKGLYNHIRDVFCISLILTKIKKKNKIIKILDYGSNKLVYSNIRNKINLKKINFSIYDPFVEKIKKIKSNINIFNEKKFLMKKWDMVNFGSSIQYIEKLSVLNEINFFNCKVVLITHTPISLSKKYYSKQKNHKNLKQNIHSFNEVVQFFKKKKFKLVFKSRNNDKFIAAYKKHKTYSLNLLFIK